MAIMAAWLLSPLADGACRHVGGHRSASALAKDKVKKKIIISAHEGDERV